MICFNNPHQLSPVLKFNFWRLIASRETGHENDTFKLVLALLYIYSDIIDFHSEVCQFTRIAKPSQNNLFWQKFTGSMKAKKDNSKQFMETMSDILLVGYRKKIFYA